MKRGTGHKIITGVGSLSGDSIPTDDDLTTTGEETVEETPDLEPKSAVDVEEAMEVEQDAGSVASVYKFIKKGFPMLPETAPSGKKINWVRVQDQGGKLYKHATFETSDKDLAEEIRNLDTFGTTVKERN